MRFYKLVILTRNEKRYYNIRQMSCYEWDQLMGFQTGRTFEKLDNDLNLLDKVCNAMIKHNFLREFYAILDENRRYLAEYKNDLISILYGVHCSAISIYNQFREPSLVYIEGDNDNGGGDYIKYSFINEDEWNYHAIVSKVDAELDIVKEKVMEAHKTELQTID